MQGLLKLHQTTTVHIANTLSLIFYFIHFTSVTKLKRGASRPKLSVDLLLYFLCCCLSVLEVFYESRVTQEVTAS